MKSLVHLLRSSAQWAITHDDDAIGGVYAVPGPRAQGDEAASEPVLSATLLDDMDGSRSSESRDEETSSTQRTDDGDPPPDGDLN